MSDLSLVTIVFFSTMIFVMGVGYFIRYVMNSESAVVRQRIDMFGQMTSGGMSQDQKLDLLKKESAWEKNEFFSEFPPFLNLPTLLIQAGMNVPVMTWFYQKLFIAAAVGIGVWVVTQRFLTVLAAFTAVFALGYMSIIFTRKRRLKIFETNLAQSMEVITRSLRAGHPLSMGIYMVSTEMPSPVRDEFGRVFQEQRVGIPIEEALRRMVQRVPLLDLRFFVLSVMIHSQTGGDLAEILDNLSKVVRDRFKVLGQVRALTAEGRLSGWVLSLLPVFVFFVILSINPGYITLLTNTELGQKMIYVAVTMQFIGILFIRKIVNIKV